MGLKWRNKLWLRMKEAGIPDVLAAYMASRANPDWVDSMPYEKLNAYQFVISFADWRHTGLDIDFLEGVSLDAYNLVKCADWADVVTSDERFALAA